MKTKRRTEGIAKVEDLPSMCTALDSIPSTEGKKKGRQERKEMKKQLSGPRVLSLASHYLHISSHFLSSEWFPLRHLPSLLSLEFYNHPVIEKSTLDW
jgi:hypothetical protein